MEPTTNQANVILTAAVRQSIQLLQLGDDAAGVRPILEQAIARVADEGL